MIRTRIVAGILLALACVSGCSGGDFEVAENPTFALERDGADAESDTAPSSDDANADADTATSSDTASTSSDSASTSSDSASTSSDSDSGATVATDSGSVPSDTGPAFPPPGTFACNSDPAHPTWVCLKGYTCCAYPSGDECVIGGCGGSYPMVQCQADSDCVRAEASKCCKTTTDHVCKSSCP